MRRSHLIEQIPPMGMHDSEHRPHGHRSPSEIAEDEVFDVLGDASGEEVRRVVQFSSSQKVSVAVKVPSGESER